MLNSSTKVMEDILTKGKSAGDNTGLDFTKFENVHVKQA